MADAISIDEIEEELLAMSPDRAEKSFLLLHEMLGGNTVWHKHFKTIRAKVRGIITPERNEELFHFVRPELDEDEAWHIHDAVKRLVACQKAKEICRYLKELSRQNKVLLPESPSIARRELIRMGMPDGEGFSEKHFSSCYLK